MTLLRTTQEYFLSDEAVRTLLGLTDKDVIVEIKRQTFAWGPARNATLNNLGFTVTVVKAVKANKGGPV